MENHKDFSVWEIQDGHGTRLGFYQSPRAALKCVARGFGVERADELLICSQNIRMKIPRRESSLPSDGTPARSVKGKAFFKVGAFEALALLEAEGKITLKASKSASREDIFSICKRSVYP